MSYSFPKRLAKVLQSYLKVSQKTSKSIPKAIQDYVETRIDGLSRKAEVDLGGIATG